MGHTYTMESGVRFLCLVALLTSAAAGFFSPSKAAETEPSPYPRGVPEYLAEKYSGKTFTCDNGSKVLPSSSINDNFCDCEDGSDEPGTSACLNGIFHCINKGYRVTTIPSSRVDDGICDCCDGTDEGIVTKCPNTCAAKATEEKGLMDKMTAGYKKGSGIRAGYISKLEDKRKKTEATVATLRDEMAVKQVDVNKFRGLFDGYEKEVDSKEAQLRETLAKKTLSLTGLDSLPENQIAPLLSAMFTLFDMPESEVVMQVNQFQGTSGESTGGEDGGDVGEMKCPLNKDASDERLTPLCHAFAEDIWASEARDFILHLVEEKEAFNHIQLLMGYYNVNQNFDKCVDFVTAQFGSNGEATGFCPAAFASLDQKQCTMGLDLQKEIETFKLSLDKLKNPYKESYETAVKARDEISQKIAQANNGNEDIEKYSEFLEFLALKGTAFDMVDGQFKYTLFVMDKIEQKETSGSGKNTLGKFDGIHAESDGTVVMKFASGDYCWATKGPRTAEVRVTCGPENKLTSVIEPSVCNYLLTFESPAACSPKYARFKGIAS